MDIVRDNVKVMDVIDRITGGSKVVTGIPLWQSKMRTDY